MSYTKGPWKVNVEEEKFFDRKTGEPQTNRTYWIEKDGAIFIGNVNKFSANVEGNSRLIAAAPEMFELLKAYYDDWDNHYDGNPMDTEECDRIGKIRELLARVEGPKPALKKESV